MKTVTLTLAGIFGFLALIFMWAVGVSNHLVTLEEGVKEKESQVSNVYQRRYDLIPNLVNTVKGYAKHESQVFIDVTEARAKVGQVQVNGAQNLPQFDKAQGALTQSLSRLLVVAEKYPELKANQNFLDLQSQLEGTENRITVERMRFNDAAREYNTYLKKFPASMIAGFRNFKEKPYFQSDVAAQTAPRVEF